MLHLPRNIDLEPINNQNISIDNDSLNSTKIQTYAFYNDISNSRQNPNQSTPIKTIDISNYYQRIYPKIISSEHPDISDITPSLLVLNKATQNYNALNHNGNEIKQLLEHNVGPNGLDAGGDFDEFSEHYLKNNKALNNHQPQIHKVANPVIEFSADLTKQSAYETYNYNVGMKTPYSSITNRNPFLIENKDVFDPLNHHYHQQNPNKDNYITRFDVPIKSEYKCNAAFKLLRRKISPK